MCMRVNVFVNVCVCVHQLQPELRNTEAFLSVSNMWEQLITVSSNARNLTLLSVIILIFEGV